jgi:hypothetical protein
MHSKLQSINAVAVASKKSNKDLIIEYLSKTKGQKQVTNPFDIRKRYSTALMKLPNVVGLAVGPKIVNGRPTDIMAIKVYVRKKLPKEQLDKDLCVPERIEGVPTDIEEQDVLWAHQPA